VLRRRFIFAVGAAAAIGPVAARAQQAQRVWRIGWLAVGAREQQLHLIEAFEEGLRSLGYVVGGNATIEFRFAAGQSERLAALAAELVELKVDLIVVSNNSNAAAAMRATRTIPIVMANSIDPVGSGLVASLARPGGNVTGYAQDTGGHEIEGKRLELLKDLVPGLSRLGVLQNPDFAPNSGRLGVLRAPAARLNLSLALADAQTPQTLDAAFARLAGERAQALMLFADPVLFNLRREIAALAVVHRLPSIATGRDFAEAGMLLAYGIDFRKSFRSIAGFVDKIFKGASPAELPVEQPTAFELVVNLRTAKSLGLALPPSLFVRADEVIE
jgi:putative ABC transport system substrate-binding protein